MVLLIFCWDVFVFVCCWCWISCCWWCCGLIRCGCWGGWWWLLCGWGYRLGCWFVAVVLLFCDDFCCFLCWRWGGLVLGWWFVCWCCVVWVCWCCGRFLKWSCCSCGCCSCGFSCSVCWGIWRFVVIVCVGLVVGNWLCCFVNVVVVLVLVLGGYWGCVLVFVLCVWYVFVGCWLVYWLVSWLILVGVCLCLVVDVICVVFWVCRWWMWWYW